MAQTLTNNLPITIRRAALDDVPALIAIERQSASSAHWSRERYAEFFAPESARLVLIAASSSNQQVLGSLVANEIAPHWELENIVVEPSEQRKGIARQLLAVLIARARERNGEALFLEVRESNLAARTLYETTGFRETGHRKAYYRNPAEDAVLYRLDLH